MLSYKYTCRFKMTNYKHLSKMYILARVIALCLFGAHAHMRSEPSLWSLAENRRSLCTSDSKMEIFPWLSNIYRWRIYLWDVSYAFRKRAHSSNSTSLSGHTQPFCQSHFKLKDLSLLIHAIYYHLIIWSRGSCLRCYYARSLAS